MSYQCKFVIKNLRYSVRKWTLNFKAGKYWKLLGVSGPGTPIHQQVDLSCIAL